MRERGHTVDAILALPSQCLVRTRGGVRRTRNAIRTRLNTVAAARTPIVKGFVPALSGTHVYSGTERKFSELDTWKARVRRAVEREKTGNTKRCVDVLTQDGQARRAWRKLVAAFLTTPVRLPPLMGSTSLLRATQTTSVDTSASTMTLAAPLSLLS